MKNVRVGLLLHTSSAKHSPILASLLSKSHSGHGVVSTRNSQTCSHHPTVLLHLTLHHPLVERYAAWLVCKSLKLFYLDPLIATLTPHKDPHPSHNHSFYSIIDTITHHHHQSIPSSITPIALVITVTNRHCGGG